MQPAPIMGAVCIELLIRRCHATRPASEAAAGKGQRLAPHPPSESRRLHVSRVVVRPRNRTSNAREPLTASYEGIAPRRRRNTKPQSVYFCFHDRAHDAEVRIAIREEQRPFDERTIDLNVRELNEDMAGNIGRGRRESNPTAKSSRAEAAVGKRKRPRGGGLSLALDGSFEVRAQGQSWGGEAQGEHFVSTDPRDTLPALCFNRVSWSAEMVSS